MGLTLTANGRMGAVTATLIPHSVSTFPPLISDQSQDKLGQVQQYGDRVFCSCLIRNELNDQFFNPASGEGAGLTGWAANGSFHTAGVENESLKAPWYHEADSGGDLLTRSGTKTFPPSCLVLVTDRSISILDQADDLALWMIFKRSPNGAYSDTFGLGAGARFVPESVQYDSGVISVMFKPDYGSTHTAPVELNIDFVQDFIFIDTSMA